MEVGCGLSFVVQHIYFPLTPHCKASSLGYQLTAPFQLRTTYTASTLPDQQQQLVFQPSALSSCLARTFHIRPTPAHQGRLLDTAPAVLSAAQQIQMRIGQRFPTWLSAGESRIVSLREITVRSLVYREETQLLISAQARSSSVVLKISNAEQDHPRHLHHNHTPRSNNPAEARASSTGEVQMLHSINNLPECSQVNTRHLWMTMR